MPRKPDAESMTYEPRVNPGYSTRGESVPGTRGVPSTQYRQVAVAWFCSLKQQSDWESKSPVAGRIRNYPSTRAAPLREYFAHTYQYAYTDIPHRKASALMARDLPYFKWYPAQAKADENYSTMTDTQLGFYHRCLNHAWDNNGLPSDPKQLAMVMNVSVTYLTKMWVRVGRCFEVSEGRFKNSRQEFERSDAISKSDLGKTAAKFKQNLNDPGVKLEQNLNDPGNGDNKISENQSDQVAENTRSASGFRSTEESSSVALRASDSVSISNSLSVVESKTEKECQTRADDPELALVPAVASLKNLQLQWFERDFWPDFWMRKGKKEALKAFEKAATSEEIKDRIVAAMRAQLPEMMRREPQHRKWAQGWLNGERFEDELLVTQIPAPDKTQAKRQQVLELSQMFGALRSGNDTRRSSGDR